MIRTCWNKDPLPFPGFGPEEINAALDGFVALQEGIQQLQVEIEQEEVAPAPNPNMALVGMTLVPFNPEKESITEFFIGFEDHVILNPHAYGELPAEPAAGQPADAEDPADAQRRRLKVQLLDALPVDVRAIVARLRAPILPREKTFLELKAILSNTISHNIKCV